MSVCRWSSMNFQCDIYCYENCFGGYSIHVANNRVNKPAPEFPRSKKDIPKYVKSYKKWSDTVKHKPIGLSHDGETFDGLSTEECVATLKMLKKSGYKMPRYICAKINARPHVKSRGRRKKK